MEVKIEILYWEAYLCFIHHIRLLDISVYMLLVPLKDLTHQLEDLFSLKVALN